jgi:hypothetical protein
MDKYNHFNGIAFRLFNEALEPTTQETLEPKHTKRLTDEELKAKQKIMNGVLAEREAKREKNGIHKEKNMKEASVAGAAEVVAGTFKTIASDIYKGMYKGFMGATPEEKAKATNLAKAIASIKQVFKDNNMDFSDPAIGRMMQRVIEKNKPKEQENLPTETNQEKTSKLKDIPDKELEDELGRRKSSTVSQASGEQPPIVKTIKKAAKKKMNSNL